MESKVKIPTGLAIDSSGGPIVDPTANVRALTEAANKRQDDLRESERRYNDLRADHQRDMSALRAEHQRELNVKESSRLDSIRQVDREEVAKTALQANAAIALLAKQTTDLATTLSTQVTTTANTAEARRQADRDETNKRVSALELALSASAGKQTVVDPQVAELRAEVSRLSSANSTRTGFDAGKAAAIAGAGLLGGGGVVALIMNALKN